MLGSASNAAQKGQSQYSTPIDLAARLAQDLPAYRPVIIDLTSGPGQLLAGAANKSTEKLLGIDVDPRRAQKSELLKVAPNLSVAAEFSFIQSDLTLLYEPMRQIDFQADLFALNPPWSLNWHASRLEGLAASEVPAVAKTFKALLPNAECKIDSTLATLLIALDRLSCNGEGMLIGYTSTLDRLIFADNAPAAMLVQHIWRKEAIPNLISPDWAKDVNSWNESPFAAATVIYFSAAHESGPTDGQRPRFLPRLSGYNCRQDTVEQWKALAERAQAMLPGAPPKFHLSLRGNEIHVRLGLFDTALVKVNRDLAKTAERLNDLDGRNPIQVVMQRDERNFILGLLKSGAEWTVDPALREAVQAAVAQYNASRAPLVPLPKIQRLGYLDENDDILCTQDLWFPSDKLESINAKTRNDSSFIIHHSSLGPKGILAPVFRAGVRYPLATRSIRFTRTQIKPNFAGEDEELELSGQELAILISPTPPRAEEEGHYCFMDGALRAPNVKIGDDDGANVIHFTLQDLVDHFDIPEVPDIATTDPARYNAFVAQLHQLEQLTSNATPSPSLRNDR